MSIKNAPLICVKTAQLKNKKNLACYHIQQGKTYDYVSSLLHFNRNSVIDWVNRFNEFGIEGLLYIKKGSGRKTKLPYELEHGHLP